MRNVRMALLALGLAAMVAAPAAAQGQRQRGQGGAFGGGQNVSTLLNAESVRAELKLSAEDSKKIVDELAKLGRDVQPEERAEKTKKILADGLKPEQAKRLNQIRWQRAGIGTAIRDQEVLASLKLDDKQKDKIKEIQDESQKKMRELFGQGGQGGQRAQRGQRAQGGQAGQGLTQIQEMRKKVNDDITGVLTADQKKFWKDLIGAEFKGEIPAGGRRGGTDR